MKSIFLIGLLIAAVSASPIDLSERIDNIEKNLTHLWGMVHDMEEHHGNGVHIHLQTFDQDGGHHHDTKHLTTDGDNGAHVYLHMDTHDTHHDEHHGVHDVHDGPDGHYDMDNDIVHHHEEVDFPGELDFQAGHNDNHDHDDDDDDSEEEHDMEHGGKKEGHYHHHHHHHHHHEVGVEAHCDLVSNAADTPFKGHIHLKQVTPDLLSVDVDIDCPANIVPGTKLGLHVHEGNDMTQRCLSLGGHYNPDKVHHGARTAGHKHRHVGDWGNVVCDIENEVEHEFYERVAQLTGPHSIMNRSIVLHMGTDDLGQGGAPDSKTTGAAGGRLACCVITKKVDDHDHH